MNKQINFITNEISRQIKELQDKDIDNSFVKSVECDVDKHSVKVNIQIPKTIITEEQLKEIGDNLLQKLNNMSDEELLKELEECEPGPFSQMIEDRFTLPGMEEINNNSFDPNEHYERTKEKRFKDSCKLDGVDIKVIDPNTTLEEVIQKHKK